MNFCEEEIHEIIIDIMLKYLNHSLKRKEKMTSFTLQPRIERSFELDILLKNFRMKQKKIDKDQRILPLTAIAIDCKLWGF